MKLAHIIVARTRLTMTTLCGRVYTPAAIQEQINGVYAQRCKDCVDKVDKSLWVTITPNV